MSDDASTRARDLEVVLVGVLASIHPAARGVAVFRGLTQAIVRIDVGSDEALAAVAEDRGLDDEAIVVRRRPATWHRRATGRWPGLVIEVRGPTHEGAPALAAG